MGSPTQSKSIYEIEGTLKDSVSEQNVASAIVELWAKGTTYNYLIKKTESRNDGTFCFVLKDEDLAALKNDLPLIEGGSGSGPQIVMCGEEGPELFFRIYYQGEFHNNYVHVVDSSKPTGRTFQLTGDEVEVEVTFNASGLAAPSYYIAARLIDETTESHYPGENVKVELLIDGEVYATVTEQTTDGQGYFSFSISVTEDFSVAVGNSENKEISLKYSVIKDDVIVDTFEQQAYPNENADPYIVQNIPVTIPALGTESDDITDLASEIGLTLSSAVLTYMSNNNLEKLVDVRRFGYMDDKGFASVPDQNAVKRLNKHAELEVAESNALLRDYYITETDEKFDSLYKIGKSVRSEFMAAGAGYTDATNFEKAKFHRVAQAQQKALNNILTQARIGSRYVKNNAYFNGLLKQEHPPYCKCEDCQAAVSPLAYLADLLKYATEHIKKDGAFITIQELEDLFYQPFGQLPADCDEMEKKICQYRIAVEILRAYHADLTEDPEDLLLDPSDCQENNLTKKEKEYRDAAYFTLLELLGTSYNEIRNANATLFYEREEKLKTLTNRLGITFEYFSLNTAITGVDEPSGNNFTIAGTEETADKIKEAKIITVTGSTGNDGLYHIDSDANAVSHSSGTITITVVETTPDATVDGNIEIFVDTIQRLFIDPETEGVSEEKFELIFGLRNSNRLPLDDTQPEAEVLQWKRNYFREVWDNEDHDSDPYTKRELPIIDPDVIGPDDFRLPSYGNGGPIDLWKERKDWIENNVLGYVLQDEGNYTPKGVQLGDRIFRTDSAVGNELVLFQKIKISGSVNNDGIYTIIHFKDEDDPSPAYTEIKVKEAIPDGTDITGSLSFVKTLEITDVNDSAEIFTVATDISSELSIGDKIIVKKSTGNDGIYSVTNITSASPCDITVGENIVSDIADGEIQYEKSVGIGSIINSNKKIAVVGNVSGDLAENDTFKIINSNGNDGTYTIADLTVPEIAVEVINDCTVLTIDDDNFLSDPTESGSISYEKTLDITSIGLGAKTFIVKDVDLSEVILDNDPFEVFGSNNNDDSYTANGDATYDGFDTRIIVDEVIKGEEANGSIELLLGIDSISTNVITINGRKLDNVILIGDTIIATDNGSPTPNIWELEVTNVSYSSGNTAITVSAIGVTTDADFIKLTFPIGGIDISGKYFEVNGDFTEEIFVGYKITFEDIHDPYISPGTPGNLNNKEYEVIQVTYSDTADKSKVFVREYIDNDTITDLEPDTGNDQTFTFNRIILINVQSPIALEVFDEMLNNTSLQNSNPNFPWTTTGWTDWTNNPGWIATPGTISIEQHFPSIADDLKRGIDIEIHKENLEKNLHLSIEGFLELFRIAEKNYLTWNKSNVERVTEEEWQDFFNILVQSVKENKKADWIEEEDAFNISGSGRDITLDPRDFWISLREPGESKGIEPRNYWVSLSTPANWFSERLIQQPIIDPDLISLNKLPEITAGGDATTLYNTRKEELEKLKYFFSHGGIKGGLSGYINYMFGTLMEFNEPEYDLLQLNNELNSIEQEVATEAERKITEDLGVSLQEFAFIVNIIQKTSTIPNYSGTPEEQNYGMKLLLRVYKEKRLYPYWAAEERDNNIFTYTLIDNPNPTPDLTVDIVPYYNLLKVTIPKWRATTAQRAQWQNALKRRSRIPIVDPDIVRPEDFKTYDSTEAGYNAFALWQERKNMLQSILDGVTGSDDAAIVDMIDDYLLLPAGGFDFIADQEEAGIDISKRLDQIKLTFPAYRRLAALKKVAELPNADDLLESEKLEIYNILINSGKRRMYAAWNDEEVSHDAPITIPPAITLSQDFFKAPPTQYVNYAELIKQLPKWRATFQERQEWVRTLQGRIENVAKAEAIHADIVHKTEERTLRILRDALIQTVGDEDKFLDENAEFLTTRFLFDFKVNCCQNTTRVSQAIETLQQLHWTERTGVLEESGLDIDLIAPDFDEEWKWIGSYANWRAAMFVFLFPENLLYPTLRSHQSPGFRKLTENLRGSNRITPETACKAAKEYADYFEDVSNLTLEATCNTKTLIHNGNCDNHFVKNYRCLFYAFARGKKTNKVYVSVGEVGGLTSVIGQNFWTEVEGYGIDVVQILGSVPYQNPAGDRHIYLFAIVKEEGINKFAFLKYNLETQYWDQEYETLDLDERIKIQPGTVLVKQHAREDRPPNIIGIVSNNKLVVNISRSGYLLWNRFKADSDDLEYDEWYNLIADINTSLSGTNPQLKGFVETIGSSRDRDVDFIIIQSDKKLYSFSYTSSQIYIHRSHNVAELPIGGDVVYRGAIHYPQANQLNKVYVYYKNEISGEYFQTSLQGNINILHGIHILNMSIPQSAFALQQAAFIAPNSGQIDLTGNKDSNSYTYACQYEGSINGLYRFPFYEDTVGGVKVLKVVDALQIRMTPRCAGPYDYPNKASQAQLQWRREHIIEAVNANPLPPLLNYEYIMEAYYFVPVYIALQLQQRGHYIEALDWFRLVYDYRQKGPQNPGDLDIRKIYYGLVLEESFPYTYNLSSNWLSDPLNPHITARTRANTYTKYTLLSIIRCFEDYADAEFTIDTVESVPRARELYRQALEMLKEPELALLEESCHCDNKTDDIIREIQCEWPEEKLSEWKWAIQLLEEKLHRINNCDDAETAIDAIVAILLDDATYPDNYPARITAVEVYLRTEFPESEIPATEEIVVACETNRPLVFAGLLQDAAIDAAILETGRKISDDFDYTLQHVTGISKGDTENEDAYGFLEQTYDNGNLPAAFSPGKQFDSDTRRKLPQNPSFRGVLNETAMKYPNFAVETVSEYPAAYVPILSCYYCVPDNPIINALRIRAELNLFKIRNCMNIAGMVRELDAYAASTDTVSGLPSIGPGGTISLPGTISIKPTQYRYEVIVERAKQLVANAQQLEANFLGALEKRDAEYYNLMKAKQDLNLSKASVKLQNLKIKVAEGEVTLAEFQRDRAQIQADYYADLIADGLLALEQMALDLYNASAIAQTVAAAFDTGSAAISAASFQYDESLALLGKAASSIGQALSSFANVASIKASYERRKQEWTFQNSLANQDIKIGNQSVKIAQDRVRVADQEKNIAEKQTEFAEDTVNYLSTKFTNVDLYDWMSDVLEGVYSYFLQQATATAKMAQNQLAFERQQLPPAFIMDDYWETPSDSNAVATVGGNAPDRRGLTGSARLLQDLTKLDSFAFETDKRKLQMSKTFSLASLAPIEFQQFKQTGVINFETMMEYFDRDFPGHYLRLIKGVKVSVVALIPPTDGIKATLTSSGTSRVVIGGDIYQNIVARRDPEMVALTGARDANGLFQLQQNDKFMNPFEGSGVHMRWEFRLPKESNLFDYNSIADVLMTMDYTALNDYNYKQQVIQLLPPFHSADRPFSFRNDLADQFYELGHPETPDVPEENEAPVPITTSFKLSRTDFPANISNVRIKEFKLFFVTNSSIVEEVDISDEEVTLGFKEQGGQGTVLEGLNTPVGESNLISTQSGNGNVFVPLRNKQPFGDWTICVSEGLSEKIKNEEVQDIIMVITFSGDYIISA